MSNVTPAQWQEDVLTAFKTFMDANHPTIPIAYPNRAFDIEDAGEADDAIWVRPYILGANDDGQIRFSNSVASNHYQRNGILTIEIYIRQQGSLSAAYAVANNILLFLENPGISNSVFNNISAPQEIGPDGSWFQLTVRADWLYFTDRAA